VNPARAPRLRVLPVTPGRWPDLERLFGPRGACAGCWCQWALLSRRAYESGKGAVNKARMRRRVATGPAPGLLGYLGNEPAGWCAVGPRAGYVRLAASRVLAPVDDAPVWSIPCLFVPRAQRGRGLSLALVRGAVAWARRQGARIVEAYPLELHGREPGAFTWWGTVGTFEAAGFREVARRSPMHPVLRRVLRG